MVHLGETMQFKGKFNTALFNRPLDIAKIAEAQGALAFRAEKPGDVNRMVHAAIDANRPAVVEVIVDPEAKPPTGMRLQTLEKFFGNDVPDTGDPDWDVFRVKNL